MFTIEQRSEQFHLIGFHFYGLDLLQVGRRLQAKVSQLPQTQVDRRLPILLMQDGGWVYDCFYLNGNGWWKLLTKFQIYIFKFNQITLPFYSDTYKLIYVYTSTLQSLGNQLQCGYLLKGIMAEKSSDIPARVNASSKPCLAGASQRKMTCYTLTWTNTERMVNGSRKLLHNFAFSFSLCSIQMYCFFFSKFAAFYKEMYVPTSYINCYIITISEVRCFWYYFGCNRLGRERLL